MDDQETKLGRRRRERVSNIDLRRATLAVLLRRPGGVGLSDIVRELEDVEAIAIADHLAVSAHQRISDLLRWQITRGRVERLRPGWYAAVPDAIPKTTRWRCTNWRRLLDERGYR